MNNSVPRTTDLEGTLTEFHEFFEKRKLYLDSGALNGTPLNKCAIIQDEPRAFIRLSHASVSEIRYVGSILRDSRHGGRVEIYRVRDAEGYKMALVKQGHVIDETGEVMSLLKLAQHPGYLVNKKD
ncbi:MAG: hypothetical protein CXT77_03180 [uncultured DHVE6 group euryarchaeote]|jgi:hypothetical protein|nr:MAG: hypothetical protein CXT77_03180 [uncultured DHVE6 group euryarchaeote]